MKPAAPSTEGNPDTVDRELRALVDWAVAMRAEDIPDEVLARAALGIADSIAVAVTTCDEPEVAKFRKFVLSRGSRPESTVFGTPAAKTDRESAATANAMAMTTAEFDGGYDQTSCHAALYTIPALLAESEAAGLTVRDVLRAEVLAYELVARIALAWAPSGGSYPPLYTHSRFCAVGAGAASALARGADGDELIRAIGIAATLITVGPRNHLMQGALVRNVWPAAGTRNGMMAAQWAACGVGGLASSVRDVYSGVLGFPANANRLTNGLGDEWAVTHSYVRMHACHLFCNTMVEALLELRAQLITDGNLARIDSIVLETHKEALGLSGTRPDTSLAARFSLPHLAAATLTLGAAGPASFSHATLDSAPIASLRDKVSVKPFDMSQAHDHHWPAGVRIQAGGKTYHAVHLSARGGHGEPYTRSETLIKIDTLTQTPYPRFGEVFRAAISLVPQCLSESCSQFIGRACGH